MSLEKMELVKITGQLEQLDTVIMNCCMDGNFQAEQALQYVSNIKGFSPLNEENPYSAPLQKIIDIATASKYKFDKVDDSGLTLQNSELDEYVKQMEETLGALQAQRAELRDQIAAWNQSISELEHFTGLGIELDEVFACEFIKVRFGRLPKESFEKLDSYKSNPYVLFFPCSTDAVGYWGVYFAPLEAAQEIDRIFASLYFERLMIPSTAGTPENGIADLMNQIDEAEKSIEKLTHEIQKFWDAEFDKVQMIYTRLSRQSATFELRRYACKYGSGFYYIGWVPESAKKALHGRLKKIKDITFKIEKPEEADKTKPPVHLKNNRFFRPFEFFVEMYGLPSYGEIDPTPFFAVTYIILFGIMFGDFGQGLVLSLAGYIMWKWKKMGVGPILVRCGFSSAFFGLVFGSVFGYEHVLDPLYQNVLGLKEKPFEVMASENINTIIFTAIGIGVVLVVLSMALNVYSSIKQKHWGEALFSNNGLAGIVFYISIIYMVVSMLLLGGKISVFYVLGLIVLPLILMFLKEPLSGLIEGRPDWKPESIGDFILQNIFELLEYVLSYVSNTVSYLRVGAFVLVHAGMMMVVFALASTSNAVVNIIIVIIGNVLVIALEGLLTAIQVLRLEYYEMFSRYFQGEGRKFEPKKI